MCMIDLEPCEVFRSTMRHARKWHVCGDCGARIEPGRVYEEQFAIFEGEVAAGKRCRACSTDAKRFFTAHGGGNVTIGGFRDWLSECVWEDDSDVRWKMMLVRLDQRIRSARALDENGGGS